MITLAASVVESRVTAAKTAADDVNRRNVWLLVIAFVVGISLVGLLARSVIQETNRPIRGVMQAVDAMAMCDLTVPAQVRSRDEIGAVAQAVNTARDALRVMLAKVAGTAET